MNTSLGYSKRTLDNTKVLLSGGGDKLLSDFIGSISWDAQNRKLKYTPVGGTATDLVTLGSNALNSTAYLPTSGGTMSNTNLVTNLNADYLDGHHSTSFVIDVGSSFPSSKKIYEIECKSVFSGVNMADAPVTGWISGLVLGANWNNAHYQHYLVESTNGHWYTTNSYSDGSMKNWNQFAYITDNVASATKLQNTRKLWGNDFNGTANIGDTIKLNVGDSGRQVMITKGGVFLFCAATSGWAGGLFASSNDGSTTLGAFGYVGSGDTLTYLFIGNSYTSPWVTFLTNGNVGIGTKNPSAKFEVNGSANIATLYENSHRVITTANIGSQSVNYANSAGAVAWSNVSEKPSTFAPSSHTHSYIKGPDNRTTNNAPSWYMSNAGSASIYTEFCQTDGATIDFENRVTFTPWGDNSGQRPVQLAFNNHGMFMRTSESDTAWNSWKTIYHTGNLNDPFSFRSYVSDAYVSGTYSTISSGTYLHALSGSTSTLLHFLSEGSVSGLDIYCHTYEASSGISYRKSVDKHHFASGWYKIIDDHNIGNYFKTVNGQSIVGTGNITISGSGSVNNNTLGPTAYVNGTTSELPHIVWHIPNVAWGNLSLDSSGNFSLRFSDSTSGSYANFYANLPDYLAKSGGTMSGVLTLAANKYNKESDYALNANNSDIIGVNSICTADLSDEWGEGFQFKRSNGNWDSFRAADGTFYFAANSGSEKDTAAICSASTNLYVVYSNRLHGGNNNNLWLQAANNVYITPGSTSTDGNNCIMFGTNYMHIKGATDATMTSSSSNPRILFSENGELPVFLTYSDWDAYRGPAGLKVVGGTDATPAWFEAEGNMYAANFYTTSDRNKKQNISSFSEHIRKFQLKSTEKWHYGVIALEVPEMFRDGEEGNMTVNYDSVLSYYVGLLENKVKELESRIKELETRLEIK